MNKPAAPFILRTFGALQLERTEGDQGLVLRSGKPAALLAYLALEGRRPIDRGVLADLLWGDESPATARNSLRQALLVLRRAIGEGSVVANRHSVGLAPDAVAIDVRILEAADAADDLEAFLGAYRGPFLMHAPANIDAPAFERWSEAVRTEWQARLGALVARVLRAAVSSGDLGRAADLARAAVAVEPALDEVVVPASDALASAGANREALNVLEALVRVAARLDASSSREVTIRLERLRRVAGEDRPSSTLPVFAQRFVARQEELSALFRGFEESQRGGCVRLSIIGAAGIGKSRLLDEFESRLRVRGARVARVRFLPGMRSVPFAGLSEFLRVLCARPGALGVSERSAVTLVGLLPELGRKYPSAVGRSSAPSRATFEYASAIVDLLMALCDDRSLVLLRDDEHNIDPASAGILNDALDARIAGLCDVRAGRRLSDDDGSDSLLIELTPLTAEDVASLLSPHDAVTSEARALLARVRDETAGVPQLVLRRLRHLLHSGVLHFRDGTWEARVEQEADLVRPLQEVLRRLPPEEGVALRIVSRWGGPILDEELARVFGRVSASVNCDWRRAVLNLEEKGLLVLRDDAWVTAHELVTEACSEVWSARDDAELFLAFARLPLPDGPAALARAEHLMQVFGASDAFAAASSLLMVAHGDHSLRAMGLRGSALATRLAAASGVPAWQLAFEHRLGWFRRLRTRHQVVVSVLGSSIVLSLVLLAYMLQPRLIVEVAPMAISEMTPGSQEVAVSFVVQPRVAVVDGFGRPLNPAGVKVVVSANRGQVIGDLVRSIENGRAQFEHLAVLRRADSEDSNTPLVLKFDAGGLMRSAVTTPSGQTWRTTDSFRLIRVVVDADTTWQGEVVNIHPGDDSLDVVLTYEFTTSEALANYVVAATPTWGDAKQSVVRLAGLPRPVSGAWQTVGFRVSRPSTSGLHHILVVMDAEGGAEHLLSQTNWSAGEPVWGDGNDIAALPPNRIKRLLQDGAVETMGLLVGSPSTALGRSWAGDSLKRLPTRQTAGMLPKRIRGGVIRLQVLQP